MKPKAIVADIDGTLVQKGEKLPRKARKALTKLHEQGVLFGLASGRPFDRRILEFADRWNLPFEFDFVIGMNGNDLYIQGEDEVRHFYPLKKEWIKEITGLLKDFDCNCIVYEQGYDEVLATRMDQFMKWSIERNKSNVHVVTSEELSEKDTGKLEVHYNLAEHDRLIDVLKKHASKDWQAVITYPGTIEFQDARIHKGVALDELAKVRGIDKEDILAFGDMDNDIGLLQEAGWGVCLVNGSDATKAVADEITEYPVTKDGVGRYLEKKILPEFK